MTPDLRQAVLQASARPEIRQAVLRIYADLQSQIERRRPLCAMSGRCCRFEEFGHRLYVTTVELAAFLHDFPSPDSLASSLRHAIANWDNTGCPFQVGKLCGLHAIRPFGCRLFFCDPTATDWQHQLYEHFHAQLKHLHDVLHLPYFYVEWRQALRTLLLPDIIPSRPQT